jgi:DNA-binding beta-propeller fold protein YncE
MLLLTLIVGYLALVHPNREANVSPVVIPAATPATPDTSTVPAELVWRIEQPWGIPSVDPRTGNVWIPADAGSFAIISPDGELLETWGTSGDEPGSLDLSVFSGAGNYGGSVFDTDGNLYIVDSGNKRIQKFGPDRTFIATWGGNGKGDGQFLIPREITRDDLGRLYVTDEGRHDVQVFTSEGQFLFAFGESGQGPGQLFEPAGVAVDRDGNIWVGDFGNRRLQKFAPDGAFLGEFGNTGPRDERLGNMFGIAASADGYIFAPNSGDDRIQVFDTVGNQVAKWGESGDGDAQFDGPSEVVLDGRGNLYVSDGGSDNLRKFRILLPPLPPTDQLVPPVTPTNVAEGEDSP